MSELKPEPLWVIDVLPARSGIHAEIATNNHGDVRLRFRAELLRNWRRARLRPRLSQWSGWFDYQGQPIALNWDAFWA